MYFIGLDLGQRHDHSAIVAVQRPPRHALATTTEKLLVRMAQRIPLGMGYPEIVEVVRYVVAKVNAAGHLPGQAPCRLVVDATGVGRPVVELLRNAQLGCQITAVTITSGDRQNSRKREGGDSMNVPKVDLIAGLQTALEKGDLRIAGRMRDAGTLKRELLDVRMQRRESGYMRVGADGYGQHDDLVIALALAVWRVGRF